MIQTFSEPDDPADNMIGTQKINKNMKKFIACLLLVGLLGVISPLLYAQQDQNSQTSNSQAEVLEERVAKLEEQLQTVDNVNKLELQTQLAEANAKLVEANAKLINTDFDAFKNELRVDNEERMRAWSHWFFGILVAIAAIGGAAIVFWLKSLIADRVEKNLSGFKAAVNQAEMMKDELRLLKKDHTASMLTDFHRYFNDQYPYPERINAVSEADLLGVFDDKVFDIEVMTRSLT